MASITCASRPTRESQAFPMATNSRTTRFWLAALSSFLGCLASAGVSITYAAEAKTPPNIVLVVTDDQGYGDASCYGAADLQTPVMDAVAARGVRFTRFRVNPLCSPTR